MKTIFSKIIDREITAEIIYEDEYTIVIPDKFPSMLGQLLVISKQPVPYIFDLSPEEYSALMNTTQRVAKALDLVYSTLRTCVVIEGFEVPHVHIRLYPCRNTDLVLSPRTEAPDEELKITAAAIREKLLLVE
jgi:histidine triad (HIT) family protein